MRPWCRMPPFSAALVGLLGGTAFLCAGDNAGSVDPFVVRKLPAELAARVEPVVAANNRFALDLYAQLGAEPGNLFLSPFSISTALAMTYAGSGGQTAAEMAAVLHFAGLESVHPIYGALVSSLDRGAGLGGYQLQVANALWGQAGAAIRPDFIAATRDHYGAGFDQVDFQQAPEEARATINRWVAQRTADRIQNLFPPGTVTRNTRLVLANAIMFKGKWAEQFKPALTRPGPFHVTAERTVETAMMHGEKKAPYAEVEGISLLELPYRGEDLAMVILLPAALDGLPALEARLTPGRLAAWLGALAPTRVRVTLPRFRMTTEADLPPVLERLGMRAAFRCDEADFSALTDEPGWCIQQVRHQAYVDVNEEGTEAAAATGVGVGVVSMPPMFVADRPFLFLIRDRVTGSILFLGRVVDPAAAGGRG